jgi:NCK adaptor protein
VRGGGGGGSIGGGEGGGGSLGGGSISGSGGKMGGSVVNLVDRPHLIGKEWYYGSISRAQCDTILNQAGNDGDFLIRDSETNVRTNYILSPLQIHYFNI